VVLASAMNFQVSVDGGSQTQFQFDGVCSGCSLTYYFIAYNIQSLQLGTHSLDLTLLDATGTNSVPGGLTSFSFQYAAINETDAFPTQTTSSTVPTSAPSSQATSLTAAHATTASATPPAHTTTISTPPPVHTTTASTTPLAHSTAQ
jgi:hypothetical protein